MIMAQAPKELPYRKADFRDVESLTGLSFDQQRAFSWHNTKKYIKCKLWDRSHICQLCGREILLFKTASLDHIIPRSAGGRTRERNLRLAHKKCNSARNSKPEDYPEWIKEVAFTPMTKNQPKESEVIDE